ncbi:extracellular calcium-sensing receptor [Xenopus laevis]|uniref:Extracellular calcium-sensing receptor n=2 Tax=Xenopus laevis TaxID=8355 RepID=A0A8J0UPB7_XENLA|nr:extracellular calcium-sensing receptor [Xenopus laevis]
MTTLHVRKSCSLPNESISGYMSHPGDIIIGGTFRVHWDRVYNDFNFTRKPPEFECQRFATEHYQTMHAIPFAVKEINEDPELLPNITLGFQVFDTCNSLRRTAEGTLMMVSGGQDIMPNYNCFSKTPLAGIVGDAGSSRSIFMGHILGLYRYPQISYFSTNPILSERDLFPSFFRTIPSDEFQMRGLAQLVFHFGWTWVGFLASDNEYGQSGLQIVKQEIIKVGICVAFAENILTGLPNRNAPYLAKIIKNSTAKVIVVISSDPDFVIVVEEMLRQNITGNIWVVSESLATSNLLSQGLFQLILLGTIGFAIQSGQMPMFNQYLRNLSPSEYLYDSFIREFWEEVFSCKWITQDKSVVTGNATANVCTGHEKMDTILTEEEHRLPLNVYTAVYAIAWGLQNLLYCTPGTGLFHNDNCVNISSFRPWQLLKYVKNVNFKTKGGRQVFFNANGDIPPVYDIVNWRLGAKGTLKQVKIGRYDIRSPETFKVDNTAIMWTNGENQVPLSNCSPSCPMGFRKVILPEKPLCCYNCARCPQGQISNQTDAVECHPCSWDTWPNLQQDRCLPRTTEFLSYEEPLGYSLAATALFSSVVPLVILGVFINYKKTPIVQANNCPVSCLLLLSLFLCFLCSLGFIGYPQPTQCLLRQVAFGMVFALCISCVLAKTITVVIAFNATKPGSRLKMWIGLKVSYSIILLCVFIQLFLCMMWLIFSPPFHELDTENQLGIITVACNEGSPTAFWCMLGYLGLLASISFIVAFLARHLPDRFNEAKFITFSMLAFLSVWVSFIPAYLSARGMYTVAMEVFAILSSSWAMVICIFVPKCFIILFRSSLNSKEPLTIKSKGQK